MHRRYGATEAATPLIPSQDWAPLYDLVTRYSRGLDTKDYDLVRSVWTPDARISYDLSNVKERHFTIKWSEGDWMGARPSAEQPASAPTPPARPRLRGTATLR